MPLVLFINKGGFMLRIISFLILLIISQIANAETVAAIRSASKVTVYYLSTTKDIAAFNAGNYHFSMSAACEFNDLTLDGTACVNSSGKYSFLNTGSVFTYSCSTGYFLSDSAGNADSSGQYCTKNECADSAGLTQELWFPRNSVPTSGCYAGCTLTVGVAVNYDDTSVEMPYVYQTYKYTDKVCTGDMNYTDAATAEAANAAAQVAANLQAQKDACGAAGYTEGTANGQTVITCKTTDTTNTTSSATGTDSGTDTTSGATGTNTDPTTVGDTGNTSGTQTGTVGGGTGSLGGDGYGSGGSSSSGSDGGNSSGTSTSSASGTATSSGTGTDSDAEEESDDSGDFDSSGTGAALSDLLADKADINAMIQSGGPGVPAGTDGFGIESTWYWPAGSCETFSVDISISDLNGQLTADKMCDYWNSVANPVFSWVLYLMTALYVYYLWDKTLADVAKAG